ncbi:MAG: EF-P lysine aminoacylase EpmA [Desulfobulbaceae bacterium]|nr:EF-P lysine aminoacylase EpmA [Desulfobulbaceae bacterium]HIJ78131.1 EF-P lysine aminoacylase GenX [Deltaproteobacteria bacterium]
MIDVSGLQLRAVFIQALRSFFIGRGYLEVDTPLRIPAPAPELHIQPFASEDWYLQTSPELCMKRLLAAGIPKIFQICKCFRKGERGGRHLPEFTMLEWYAAGRNYLDLMDDCEALLRFVGQALGRGSVLKVGGGQLDLAGSWERLSVAEAFARYAPRSVDEALADDMFDEDMVVHIEPHLGRACPTFLYDYPAPLGALARRKKSDSTLAERFELYINGLELANGFSELTDPIEQRRRFEKDLEGMAARGLKPGPMPESFLRDLPAMPEAAGIALGVDRLAMIFADGAEIDRVVAFVPEEL